MPESQQGQDSPGTAQSLFSPAWTRAGLTAAQETKDGKLQRHFMSVSEMAGRIHTFPNHPLQKLPAPGKHQLTEIRPERDKTTKIKFGNKANVAFTQRPCPGSKQERACKQREISIPEGFCQCFPEDLTHSPGSREELVPPEHRAGEPKCVPAPVLWKPRKMEPFPLLRN